MVAADVHIDKIPYPSFVEQSVVEVAGDAGGDAGQGDQSHFAVEFSEKENSDDHDKRDAGNCDQKSSPPLKGTECCSGIFPQNKLQKPINDGVPGLFSTA